MKKLYRLEIAGWWPVVIEEEQAATMSAHQRLVMYGNLNINPYDLDDLTLRLVRATAADIAKYGEDACCGEV